MSWTGRLLAAVATVPLILSISSVSAYAAPTENTLEKGEKVTFTVADTGDLPRDGKFDFNRLDDLDTSTEKIEAAAADESPETQQDTKQQNPYEVVGRWDDVDGDATTIRAGRWSGGDSGFGLDKIERKHNLGMQAARAFTQSPDGLEKHHDSGTSYNYYTTVLRVECDWLIFCNVVDRQPTTTKVDFRDARGEPFGVVTSYCDGIEGRCPDWVREIVA